MENKPIQLSGRLDGSQRNKLKGLFDMFYSPRELAEELGINKDQFYMVYIPLGCPHERDTRNHILINGLDFSSWYCVVYKKIKLREDADSGEIAHRFRSYPHSQERGNAG